MTDTPTPPTMTPEQRAELVAELHDRACGSFDAGFNNDAMLYGNASDLIHDDGVTIATLTAERDTAQDRAYRLAVAIMGGEDAPGLADSLPTETLETLARSNFQKHSEDIDRLIAAQAEIARLTAALATAREDGMRDAANSALQAAGQEYVLVHTSENEDARMGRHSAVRGMMVRMGIYAELEDAIEAAITKGSAT